MTETLHSGLDALAAGGPVLLVLGLASVWVWTLIILTAVQVCLVRRAARQPQASIAGWSGCSRRVRRRLVRVRIDSVVHEVAANASTVLVLAALAPVLGLLGTVEGMIATFKILAAVGGADVAALGDGISQALVTTQGGLMVSIPSLLAGGVLVRKVQKVRDRLQASALQQCPDDTERGAVGVRR